MPSSIASPVKAAAPVVIVTPMAEAEIEPTKYRALVAFALLRGCRVVIVHGMKACAGKERAAELWRAGSDALDRLEREEDPGRRLGEFFLDGGGVVRERTLWPVAEGGGH